jgi:N-acetyl-anhydromuramyl-L-alanine amidase AmpD
VIHRSGGSLNMLRDRFADPSSATSAHYAVGLDGVIHQYVDETDTAFHAGVVVNASWPGLKAGVNPNFYTIGIEHEGERDAAWPEPQQRASAQLIADVASRWSIALTPDTIIPHRAIRASAHCPGSNYPFDAILNLARQQTIVPAAPVVSRVRTIVNANLRVGAPNVKAPIVSIVPSGTEVAVTGFTDAGERVSGNALWYIDAAGNFLWAGATNVPNPSNGGPSGDSSIISTDGMEFGDDTSGTAVLGDGLRIDRTTLPLPSTQYYVETPKKDLIVLHFTAGQSARSAVSAWRTNPEHVATAYVVDTDGTVFEVFPPACWAYHLGIKGGTAHERRSIGIEIANVGPLQRSADGTGLNWWPKNWQQRYCGLDESTKYVESAYREKQFFASYADAQVDAVGALVRRLCEQFDIERRLSSDTARLAFDPAAFAGYTGVATHANFRNDKWDVGPAFPWDRLQL